MVPSLADEKVVVMVVQMVAMKDQMSERNSVATMAVPMAHLKVSIVVAMKGERKVD